MVEQIVTLRNSLSTESRPRLTMKFLGLTICSTTLSAMCYLFYYTECSFLLVSFFFLWFWCPEFQLLLSLNVLNYDIIDVAVKKTSHSIHLPKQSHRTKSQEFPEDFHSFADIIFQFKFWLIIRSFKSWGWSTKLSPSAMWETKLAHAP